MTMCKWTCSLVVSSLLIGGAMVSLAQGPQPGRAADPAEDEKTTITSKRMTVKNQESRAIFEGAVVLTRGSMVVHADRMEVYFQSQDATGGAVEKLPAVCRPNAAKSQAPVRAPKEKGAAPGGMPAVSNRSICLMEATGHVVIEKDEGRATGQKAVYQVLERKVVLTGDPVACQRGTRVSGERITMFLDDDRSEVEGGSQVLLNPDGGRCLP